MSEGFKPSIDRAIVETKHIVDPELRSRAFQVILSHLIEGPSTTGTIQAGTKKLGKKTNAAQKPITANTLPGRIQSLKDEDFFQTQHSLADVREELRTKGWHYPVTSLSGPLQLLVRQRELRREQVSIGKKKVWKYSNF